MRRFIVAASAALLLVLPSPAAAKHGLRFLGQAIVPTGTTFKDTVVGGLSSITYDQRNGRYYALSDDPADVRFYTVSLDIRDGRLSDGDVRFEKVTRFLSPPYSATNVDPEGLVLTADRKLILTSEGIATTGVPPFVRRYNLDGAFRGDLRVPPEFFPTPTQGVRFNLGFESAGVLGRHLYVATENALVQDGPAATITNGSRARILRYDLSTNRLERQWFYETDPVAEPPVPPTAFSVNGVVELLPLSSNRLIAMERSFSVGAPGTGNKIKLYTVTLTPKKAHKRLLLDLDELGLPLDNVEGMTFGPRLRDGRQSLVLVSDNNFAASQFTQFLLFGMPGPPRGRD
ncbi:MAG TPA: esterase-like activity of phytase family protein [Solirubrobacter sp.]|nr:esterase-like activity of phytase family protein [Solirubrobacter sp.]